MARVGMIVLAVLMLAGGGALEVLRGGSRVDAATVRLVQDRFNAVPYAVGDWTGQDVKFEQKLLDRAEAQAHFARRYVHGTTGEAIEVLILAGNPQAIGAHDPTVCYAGSGYAQEGSPRQHTIQPDPTGPGDGFWSARFSIESPPATLELFWAWGTHGRWTAAENPRFDFATEPLLLKIYVSRPIGPTDRSDLPNPTEKLLTVLLPKLSEALNPATP